MAKKSKISLTNSISKEDEQSFDEMLDSSLDESIKTQDDFHVEGIADECSTENNSNVFFEDNDETVTSDIFSRKDKICPFADKKLNEYDDVNEKMIEIYNEFVNDTKLTIANISSVAQNEAFIKGRWCSKLMAAKIHHKKLKAEYKELQTKIRDMVTEKSKTTAFLKQKMSIDSIVSNDANLKDLWKKVEEAALLEELYVHYYEIIKGMGFQIRNSIDTLNFERGM